MANKLSLFSFNNGEIAPELHHRSDLQKYRSSLKRCENFFVMPQGGLKRRRGTKPLAKIEDIGTYTASRIWIWEVDRELYYIMVFIDSDIRFYDQFGSLVYTLSSIVYNEIDWNDLYFKQVYDVLFIASSSYPLARISRTSASTWVYSTHNFNGGPFDDYNSVSTNLLTFNTGSPNTITSVNPVFDSSDVGRRIKILNEEALTIGATYTSSTTSGSIPASGSIIFKTEGGTWAGEVFVELSVDNGSTWEIIASVRSESNTNRELTRDIDDFGALVRVRYAHTSGTIKWTLEVEDQIFSYFTIISFNSTTSVDVDVDFLTPSNGYSSHIWALGTFCELNGYPSCVEIFEERMMLAGVPTKPATVYGSKTNNWNTWSTGILSTSSITFTLSNDVRNRIRWMIPETQLILGTDYGEWTIGSRDNSSALAGDNVNAKRHTQKGSASVQPILSGETSLYIEAGAKRLRSVEYSYEKDGYKSSNLSILAQHITEDSGFKRLAYTSSPDELIYILREDGELYTFTNEREHQVNAWAKHTFTNASIEDIAVVSQTNGDEVCLIVKRENGVYLERISNDNLYFDWQTTYNNISSTDVISLLGEETFNFYGEDLNEKPVPFEGKGVYIWVDYVGAGVSDLVIKYNGTDLVPNVDYMECTKDGNYMYWYPEGTDASLVAVFDFTTPLTVNTQYEAFDYSDCYVVDIIIGVTMANINVKVSGVAVDSKFLYRMAGKNQVLVLDQAGVSASNITVEESTIPIDPSYYRVFRPQYSFGINGSGDSVVYTGIKYTSLMQPVDIFNIPDAGGAGTSNRVTDVEVFVVDSIGGEVSTDNGVTYFPLRFVEKDQTLGVSLDEKTGKYSVKSSKGADKIGSIIIKNDSPYKMKISAMALIGTRLREK